MFLEVITGPMFSGKSEELLRRIRRAAYAKKKISVIKPGTDDRKVRSIFNLIREDKKLSKYPYLTMATINSPEDLANAKIDEAELLAIDEAQFFEQWFADIVADVINDGERDLEIIIVGLDMDAWRKPFGAMPEFMARADSVSKLTAICLECVGAKGPAIFTQKKSIGSGKQIEVGDTHLYEARCRVCHTIPE
jgi:thymidine kinase